MCTVLAIAAAKQGPNLHRRLPVNELVNKDDIDRLRECVQKARRDGKIYVLWPCIGRALGPLANWDTSNVENMSRLFEGLPACLIRVGRTTSHCEADLSKWDVSRVTDMSYMFSNATSFNKNIAKWDVSRVTNMSYMFSNATCFNKNIKEWDVSRVTNMSYMFSNATSFNKNIAKWDVSSVRTMDGMFAYAKSFMQTLCGTWVDSNASQQNMFVQCPGSICTTTTTTVAPVLGAEAIGAIIAGCVATGVGIAAAVYATNAGIGAGAAAAGAGATAASGVALTHVAVSTTVGLLAYGAISVPLALLAKYGLKPMSLHQTNIMSPETSVETMLSKEVLRVKDAPDMDLMEAVTHFTSRLSKKNLVRNNEPNNLKPIKKKKGAIVIDRASRCLEWARDRSRPSVPGAADMSDDQVCDDLD